MPGDNSTDLNYFTGGWVKADGYIQGDGAYSKYLNLNGYVFTPSGAFKYLNALDWTWDGTTTVTLIPDSDPVVTVIMDDNFPR